MERKSFLDQEPPPGYIAGIGRGVTGFSTRSFNQPSHNHEDTTNVQDIDTSLTSSRFTKEDDQDLEADKIYEDIEAYLKDKRHKKRKGETKTISHDDNKVVAEEESVSQSIAKISEQFQDVKQELASISPEQWENLPESGDFTRRNKRLRQELQSQQRFYRNSDMIAVDLKNSDNIELSLDDFNTYTDQNDESKQSEKNQHNVDLFELSRTRDRLLENQIMMGSQNTKAQVDPKVYLEALNPNRKTYNIGDYKKTRKLLAKLCETNPHNPQNWIASAKLELEAQKLGKAKQIIQEGCERCPKSEETWLTNLEINQNDTQMCKVIVAEAIKYNYKSVKLWMKAVSYESDNLSKSRIIRKALEWLPRSEELWIAAAQYESENSITIKLLEKAVTLIPNSVNLWLQLASVQDPILAIETLLKGAEKVPVESAYLIWIKIAKLEEKMTSNEVKVNKFVMKAVESSTFESYKKWIEEAERCEKEGFKITCRSIIMNSLETVDPDELIKCCKVEHEKNFIEVTDSMYTFMTTRSPQNESIWEEYLSFKKNSNDFSGLFLVYELAIEAMPNKIDLYTQYCDAKLRYDFDLDLEKIRMILSEALDKYPENEVLWLYSINFEFKHGSTEVAMDLFESCENVIKTPSVKYWLNKASLLSTISDLQSAVRTLETGIKLYPGEPEFYLEKSNFHELQNEENDTRSALELGIKACDNNDKLYIALSSHYIHRHKNVIKSRSILEDGLSKHPSSDILHHARIKLEITADNKPQAQRLLSKAISLIPDSPILWCDNIKLATKQQLRTTYALALKRTNDNPIVILTIAKDLWKGGKIDKAHQFFKAGLDKDPAYGDLYIYYYAFLLNYGSREDMESIENRMSRNMPLHGHKWERILRKNILRNVEDLQLVREAAVDITKLM
ncbi:hypothetical protein CANINC_002541 [Pichia inconspicua]|uniref:PRP1 splicing factor N-terminal domain-containing protein n=1 Tax=Pichia inconspicua TaxID=52247 RepID=A0A4T0X1E0_9ASCO|nr:hypothetical protein CANINC_002541 [[Candida] inconspicua]